MNRHTVLFLAFIAAVSAGLCVAYLLPEASRLALHSEGEVLEVSQDGNATSTADAGTDAAGAGTDMGSGTGAGTSTEASATTSATSSLDDADSGANATSSDIVSHVTASSLTTLPVCTVAAALSSSSTPGPVLLNEVAWMGSVPKAGETSLAAGNREWIELKNISGSGVDLANWQLLDSAGNIKIAFSATNTIPAGNFYLLGRGSGTDGADRTYTGALSNVGDALVLFDDRCGVVDLLNASSGWPGGNNTTKQTLERDANGTGWHTSVLPGGTPRAENSVSVPTSTATSSNATDTGSTSTTSTSTACVQACAELRTLCGF